MVHPVSNHPLNNNVACNGGGNHMRTETPNASRESISNSGMHRGDHIIWKSIESIPKKVWNSIKEMGIEGDEDYKIFEGLTRDFESREQRLGDGTREINNHVP